MDFYYKMNFTASFLNFVDCKIVDDLGGTIFTMHYSKEQYPFSFRKPALSYSIIEENAQLKEPVIKRISLEALDKKGFCIIKIPLEKHEKWNKRSKYRHELVRLNNPITSHYRFLTTRDSQIQIMFDEANLRIKLIGEKVNKKGETEWQPL